MKAENEDGRAREKEKAPPGDAPEKTEHPDYYFENGLMVMTAAFHLKRGFCCGNACLHCPYDHENVGK